MEKNEQLKGLEIKLFCPFCKWESEDKPLIGEKIFSVKEEGSKSYKINEDQSAFVEVFKKHLSDSDSCFSLFLKEYIRMEELISRMLSKK